MSYAPWTPLTFFPGDNPDFFKNAMDFFSRSGLGQVPEFLRVQYVVNFIKSSLILSEEFARFESGGLAAYRKERVGFEIVIKKEFDRVFKESFQPPEEVTEFQTKKKLTDIPLKGKVGSVKSPLTILWGHLARVTLDRGKKAALAKFLNVTPSRVSEWIHGVKEPSGEVTLRLLEWVEAEEAQQKTPGGGENAAKGKTRSIHSKDETNKSGPIKS